MNGTSCAKCLPALVIALALLSGAGYLPSQTDEYAMHRLNTTSPSHYKANDDSLLVRGVYWELPLAGVHTLVLDSNKLVVTGDSLTTSDSVRTGKVIRTIPSDLVVSWLVKDTSGVWWQSDAIACFGSFNNCYRKFYKFSTGQSFVYKQPFRSEYEILHVFLGRKDTAVFTMAFGKMNQDKKKWMGYILVTGR